MQDFDDDKQAFELADKEIALNAAEYGHDVTRDDRGDPRLDRFYYVKAEGKKRKWKQEQIKELTGAAACKSAKQLEDAGAFVAGLGPSSSSIEGQSSVKVENAIYAKVIELGTSLKSEIILNDLLANVN